MANGKTRIIIATVVITFLGLMISNDLTSTVEGTVEGVIVKQWKKSNCTHNQKAHRCKTKYNNRVKLSNGEFITVETENWYREKTTGDVVTLNKKRGGFLNNVYYKPQ